jgi:sugar transferase (PEP-CTERM/EpsH1 system associated)
VSQAETDLYRQCCGDGPVYAAGNGVDLDYFSVAPLPKQASCVFVGALDYRPNVDGVCWFCQDVWPTVHKARPDARLALVGRKPVAAVERLAAVAGVTVVGQVPDVRPYLAAASVALAPLRIARGVQNKVLEAMAMGRPTIASPQALEGLDVVPGREALCASSPEEWGKAILELLANPASGQRLALMGRRYVEQNHCWESCLAPFEDILGTVNHTVIAS